MFCKWCLCEKLIMFWPSHSHYLSGSDTLKRDKFNLLLFIILLDVVSMFFKLKNMQFPLSIVIFVTAGWFPSVILWWILLFFLDDCVWYLLLCVLWHKHFIIVLFSPSLYFFLSWKRFMQAKVSFVLFFCIVLYIILSMHWIYSNSSVSINIFLQFGELKAFDSLFSGRKRFLPFMLVFVKRVKPRVIVENAFQIPQCFWIFIN